MHLLTSLQLMMDFKSYYRTTPKEPLALPASAEPKPPTLPRAPSIKINTKGPGTPRPSVSFPADAQTSKATPLPRQPSAGLSKPAGAADTPVSSAKRPRPDSEERGSVAKRPKTETPSRPNGHGSQRSKLVTLRTTNPKRLALILGKPLSASPSSAARRSLPAGAPPKKESSPEAGSGIMDSIVAKPVRKPLPSGGDSVRKPLPTGGSSMSPPPPPPSHKMTVNTNVAQSATNTTPAVNSNNSAGQASSPPPATPGSATGRPKIKIVRKSQSGPSQSPPAP